MYCVADDNGDKFRDADLEDVSSHQSVIQERPLTESLSHGIGHYHEARSKNGGCLEERLVESGAFKVLLVSRAVGWGLGTAAYMVIVMGAQFFKGRNIVILAAALSVGFFGCLGKLRG